MLLQCIAFDLDDTLYLKRDYVRSGFRAVGEWAKTSLGVPDFADRFEFIQKRFADGDRTFAYVTDNPTSWSPIPSLECIRISSANACETD